MLDITKNKEYEVEAIKNSGVYVNKVVENQLSKLYYLVFWKSYLEAEKTCKPALAMIYLCKIISTFHKYHSKKPPAKSLLINSILPIAKPLAKPLVKTLQQKQS